MLVVKFASCYLRRCRCLSRSRGMEVLLWLGGSYYVLSLLCTLVLLWIGARMYVSYPWVYYKLVLLPFVGFWLFLVLWVEDVRDYFMNSERLKDRKDGN